MNQRRTLPVVALLVSCALALSSCATILEVFERTANPNKETARTTNPVAKPAPTPKPDEELQPVEPPQSAEPPKPAEEPKPDNSEKQDPPKVAFPPEVKQRWVERCVEEGSSLGYCTCITDKLSEEYGIVDAILLLKRVDNGDEVAQAQLDALILSCDAADVSTS